MYALIKKWHALRYYQLHVRDHKLLYDPHMGLDGKKSIEAAGTGPNFGDDKYRTLIQNASTKSTFITALGKRIQHMDIDNNGERIRIVQKRWLDKKT